MRINPFQAIKFYFFRLMSTELEIRPFLIGRSYDRDYRVIVTPEFLAKTESTYLLSNATGEMDVSENNCLFYRQVYPDTSDPFTIIFWIKKIKKSLIESSNHLTEKSFSETTSTDFLVDRYGREINLVEGFVVETIAIEDFNISSDFFEKIHAILIDYFINFWEGDTETKIIGSRMYLNSDFESSMMIQKIEPFKIRSIKPISEYESSENLLFSFVSSKKPFYIAVFAIILLFILNLRRESNCVYTISSEAKIAEFKNLKDKYPQEDFEDEYLQIWRDIASKKNRQQQKNYSNWTMGLFEDNEMKSKYPLINSNSSLSSYSSCATDF